MAATERERDSSIQYVLMEDNAGITGRCMTMPHISEFAHSHTARTATFSNPSASHTGVAVETQDIVTPLPEFSRKPALQPAPSKSGILRKSVSLDHSDGGPPPKRRVKKQVSITLPGSSRPLLTPQRQGENESAAAASEIDGGDGSASDNARPDEIVVEIDVHDSAEITTGKCRKKHFRYTVALLFVVVTDVLHCADDEARVSAVELLNGHLQEGEEENGRQSDVLLRQTPRKQGSKRKSVRQSLTSSLTRIGNRMRRRKPPKLQKLQSALDLDELAQNELELKANLYWHIGTPIKRWKVERQVPIKLILQLLKTFCLIVQVCILIEIRRIFH